MRLTPPLLAAWTTLLLAGACGWGGPEAEDAEAPVPVEVAPVTRGPFAARRTLHGSLEASSRIEVVTVTSGRIASIDADIGDLVRRGQLVATLDRGEYAQAVREARAAVAMAEAGLADAEAQKRLADAALGRVNELHARGSAADAELDAVQAQAEQRAAAVELAEADIERARAVEASAIAALDATRIAAEWTGGDEERVVAERFADEGTIVSANTPLLSIVDLDPLHVVTWATERDYVRLRAGQPVTLATDAWPGEAFSAEVARVAPVFDAESRQARVELAVPNPDGRLKPGLFVTAEVTLEVRDDATTVPADAVVTRDGRPVVFVVDGGKASLRAVELGPREGDRVQVTGDVDGQVVVLGHQLLFDGAPIEVAAELPAEGPPGDG